MQCSNADTHLFRPEEREMQPPQDTLLDKLAEAVTGRPPARAVHEIQAEIYAFARRIEACSEAEDWQAIHNLSEGLRHLAERGLYHASQARAKQIGTFALGNHQEREAR
jgi:hypothetical protein